MAAVSYRVRTTATADLLVLAAAALYAAIVGAVLLGRGPAVLEMLLLGPPALAGVALLLRRPLNEAQVWALGVSVLAAGSGIFALYGDSFSVYALALPVVLLGLWIARRRPVGCTVVVFGLTGLFGTFQAYLSTPAAPVADWLLSGLWIAVVIAWLNGGRKRAAWLWPGVACLAAYVVVTGISVLLAQSVNLGVESFRASTWYMAAALLVAYAPWPGGARERIAKGALGVALAVGAYSTLRWFIGPSGKEEAVAALFFNNYLDGELRTTGPFETAKQLAAWTATVAPFCFAMALALTGRWRLVAAGATAFVCLALLAPDVRAAPAAAAPAAALVLLLYTLSPAFGTRRLAVTLVAATVAVGGAVGGFVLTLGDKADTANRYQAILDPTSDESYQARLFKWRTAYEDMEEHPLGQGLGVAGRTQEQFGRYVNVATYTLDNSYLKIGLEQGFFVMVFYVATLLLLVAGLGIGAIRATDPVRAGLLMGSAGTLVAMSILFFVGNYIEGLTALGGWVLVGLGMSQSVWRTDPGERI